MRVLRNAGAGEARGMGSSWGWNYNSSGCHWHHLSILVNLHTLSQSPDPSSDMFRQVAWIPSR
eukprot:5041819-Pleurochrysis_carterae.AAC.1